MRPTRLLAALLLVWNFAMVAPLPAADVDQDAKKLPSVTSLQLIPAELHGLLQSKQFAKAVA